ncbi:flagellar protein FlaG [Amantichitinum ursilacus]|uniref:Flagellar protein FlaG n=1 Tax=Amantichitinum ursilacus TaxID=857265 RepID=A0A0N0XKE3_9NEIS|nr:flagellar protein FlaG [Amantichitinum ursilacus]KPC52701.1 flagellar protein FlaG [Amantichitinum ursilacus]
MQIPSASAAVALVPTPTASGATATTTPAPPILGSASSTGSGSAQPLDPTAKATASATSTQDAVDKLNEALKQYSKTSTLEFTVDDATKMRLVKVIDTQSKEVIRQIPSEEAVQIATAIDKFQGLLIKDSA